MSFKTFSAPHIPLLCLKIGDFRVKRTYAVAHETNGAGASAGCQNSLLNQDSPYFSKKIECLENRISIVEKSVAWQSKCQ